MSGNCPTAKSSTSRLSSPRNEKKTSPVYNDALPLSDASDSLNVRLDGPHGSRIFWAIADPVDGDGWSSAQVETIKQLLPHLRQFVRVREALIDARALGSSVMALLENTRCGIIHLDPRGRMVEANDRARDLLRHSDGLADEDGYLHASTPTDDTRLQTLLAGALPRFGGQGVSGTMTVRCSAKSAPLVLHVTPVSDGRTEARPSRVAALVLVVDPMGHTSIDPNHVSAVLGLTPTEGPCGGSCWRKGTPSGTPRLRRSEAQPPSGGTSGKYSPSLGLSRQAELMKLVASAADFPQGRR